MKYFTLAPLPETKYRGISIFPEDEVEEKFLKIKIEKIKDLEEIRKFLQSRKKT